MRRLLALVLISLALLAASLPGCVQIGESDEPQVDIGTGEDSGMQVN